MGGVSSCLNVRSWSSSVAIPPNALEAPRKPLQPRARHERDASRYSRRSALKLCALLEICDSGLHVFV